MLSKLFPLKTKHTPETVIFHGLVGDTYIWSMQVVFNIRGLYQLAYKPISTIH